MQIRLEAVPTPERAPAPRDGTGTQKEQNHFFLVCVCVNFHVENILTKPLRQSKQPV